MPYGELIRTEAGLWRVSCRQSPTGIWKRLSMPEIPSRVADTGRIGFTKNLSQVPTNSTRMNWSLNYILDSDLLVFYSLINELIHTIEMKSLRFLSQTFLFFTATVKKSYIDNSFFWTWPPITFLPPFPKPKVAPQQAYNTSLPKGFYTFEVATGQVAPNTT